LPGGTEQKHETPSYQLVSGMKLDYGNAGIINPSNNHSIRSFNFSPVLSLCAGQNKVPLTSYPA